MNKKQFRCVVSISNYIRKCFQDRPFNTAGDREISNNMQTIYPTYKMYENRSSILEKKELVETESPLNNCKNIVSKIEILKLEDDSPEFRQK